MGEAVQKPEAAHAPMKRGRARPGQVESRHGHGRGRFGEEKRGFTPNDRRLGCPGQVQNELDIMRDVTDRLERAGIAYMLTGSMAMNYYATPRMTRDIDLVVELGPADTDKVVRLFTPDYYVSREAVQTSIAHRSLFNLIHQESVIKVDCIVRKDTPYRRREFERRQRVALGDFSVWMVSKEDLIISKLWWAKDSHSELQLRDVRSLAETGCDTAYLEPWTRELGLHALWQECRP